MIPFTMGLLVLVGVLVLRDRPRVAPWLAMALGGLVVGQIWWSGTRLDGYQLRVLGQRFSLEGEVGLDLSGDPDRSDIYVASTGTESLALLSTHDSGLVLERGPGRGALVLTRGSRAGDVWRVLGSVPLRDGDRISLGDPAAPLWTFRESEFPWTGDVHRWIGADGGEAVVPYPEGAGALGLLPNRPDVFQRSYPLADLPLDVPGPGLPTASLRSFLYYEDGLPRLAILDDDLIVSGDSGEPRVATGLELGAGDGRRARVLIAGLPLRDIEEPRLTTGERYGVRPLRSFELRVEGDWLTLAETRRRVEAVAPEDLSKDAGLWLLPGPGLPQPGALQVSGYSNRFGAVSQGLLRLPAEPTGHSFRILTPSGLSDGTLGRPFMLGDGERGLLFRVDGLRASFPFLATVLVLFAVGALAFPVLRLGPGGASLALAALGLIGLRSLLSLSAWARYPFVDEGHHLSLWLIPAVPWLVGGVSRAFEGRTGGGPVSVVPRGFSGGFMGEAGRRVGAMDRVGLAPAVIGPLVLCALIVLARILFPGSGAKAGVLALLAVAVAGAVALSEPRVGGELLRGRRVGPEGGRNRSRALLGRVMRLPFPGLIAGFGLAGSRIVLDVAGFREQWTIGGTRIGLSVFYTPAVVALFALALWIHLERVNRTPDRSAGARNAARAWIDLGGFLVLALALVSAWISDFGIVLTTLPGPAALMAVVGLHWRGRFGPGAALGGALPLIVFAILQLAPGSLRPSVLQAPSQSSTPRLEDWSRNELLLLERGDPELLGLIGERRSEALAVMRETMRSYTRGNWLGKGFLQGRVSPEIRTTAAREHAAGALVASQWGLIGSAGLLAVLIALALPFAAHLPAPRRPGGSPLQVRRRRLWTIVLLSGFAGAAVPPPADTLWLFAWIAGLGALATAPLLPFGRGILAKAWSADGSTPDQLPDSGGKAVSEDRADFWWILGATAAATLVGAGLYMMLANYGLVLFTGKNVYLLGLDSVGDVLESLALLGLAGVGLARAGSSRGGMSGSVEAAGRADGSLARPVHEEWRRVG